MAKRVGSSRGQALVETALGILVIAAVLVGSIHFAEVGFVSLKVHEAAANGIWTSVSAGGGYRVHQWPRNFESTPYNLAPAKVAFASADVQTRYADFDGREGVPGQVQQLFTDASNLVVSCATNVPPVAGIGVSQEIGRFASNSITPVYEENGGVSCIAEATVNANAFFPRQFADSGDPGINFGTSIAVAAAVNVKVCGFGRPSGGTCGARIHAMIDDWSGQNRDETDQHLIFPNPATSVGPVAAPTVRNERYKEAARRMYINASQRVGVPDVPGLAAASTMATVVAGWSPISVSFPIEDEGSFFMSSSGEPTFIQNAVPPIYQWPVPALATRHFRISGYSTTPGGVNPIGTQPAYSAVFLARESCFLGRSCF